MSEILLDSQAFFHNLTYISKYLHTHSTSTKLALVLKDNAYGHGLREIASLAREFGVQDVFVKTYDEAQVVREFFSSITILYGEPKGALVPNMAIAINNKEILHSLTFGSKVELKVNTGMNRNGINPSELEEYITLITQNGLQLFGVFTHNGYGDDLGNDFKIGCENFENIKTAVLHICKKLGIEKPRFHGLNSSGTLRSQTITDDLVRVGIGAYGYLQSDATPQIAHALKPVASLWADRISSKILPKGTKIGYGGKSVLQEESMVSTYDIGYGDGFPRINEHTKLYTACGKRILPRTSMDCFSCVSDAPRICVFNNVMPIAQAFNTISYEVLTHLSPFIKRTIVRK